MLEFVPRLSLLLRWLPLIVNEPLQVLFLSVHWGELDELPLDIGHLLFLVRHRLLEFPHQEVLLRI
jgi:hypothetical protein